MNCPFDGCDYTSDSKRGISIHHIRTHGESIAMVTTECEECGQEFEYYESMQHGRFCSDECTGRSKAGERNPMKREEVVAKISGENSHFYGKEPHNKGEEMSEEFCEKMSAPRPGMQGSNHPNWKGGEDRHYYGPSWTESRRETARERDKRQCQKCGVDESDLEIKLDVHHIRPFRQYGVEDHTEANRLDNLVSLCRSCHIEVEATSLPEWFDTPLTVPGLS